MKLINTEGHALADPTEGLHSAGLRDGGHITAIAIQRQVAASRAAFAFWCCGGDKVITWGDPECGGDSSEVQDQLRDVRQIQAGSAAFAAILADGSVITWGDPEGGGDSSEVQAQLRDVQQIQAAGQAFAAILADGSVITWGDPERGGDSSEVQHQLRDVQQIQAAFGFAATLADGSVITWGDPEGGGDSSEVQDQLSFRLQTWQSLQFWQMDQSSHGAIQNVAVTALRCEIS